MTRTYVTFAGVILAIAIPASIWGAASEREKPAPAPPVPATVPVPPGAQRADPIRPATLRGKGTIPTRMYLIECKLLETAPDEQPRVLASPMLMTLEGQPAVVRVGRDVPPPKGAEAAKGSFAGLLLEVTVRRAKGGQTFLDATLQKSWTPAEAKGDRLRLVNIGLRIIEAVTLGEKIVVPFCAGDGKSTLRRFEVVVKRVGPHPTTATPSKPALKPSGLSERPGPSATAR